jgi:hypothetical protein
MKRKALSISSLANMYRDRSRTCDHEFIRGCDDDGLKRAVCTWPTALTRVPSPKSRTETTFLPRANLGST